MIIHVPQEQPDKRPENPKPMQFTDRDGAILQAVHACEGILADYQIQRLFFTGEHQARGRLGLLWQHGYLNKLNRRQRAALGFMVYWLDECGAAYIASLSGDDVKAFKWRRQPRWALISHDIAINDFRLDVRQACQQDTTFQLENWIPSGEFWAHPDTIDYSAEDGRTVKRQIRPDGLFVIIHEKRRFRFLLELDRGTEDNPRFTREKVVPGVAYLKSKAYEQRFGSQVGRWIVITTSEARMMRMKEQAERAVGADAKVFYFTTFALVKPETVLTAPIWYQGGQKEARPLLSL